MTKLDMTCWTLIDEAASGDRKQQEEFAYRYYTVVQSLLRLRWAGTSLATVVDDACQDVFVELFRVGGPLSRVKRCTSGGFRAYLFGVVRNVARRIEQQHTRRRNVDNAMDLEVVNEDTSLSHGVDRAWAVAVMKKAAVRHAELATGQGPDAVLRHELLRLRFRYNMTIKEIASHWGAQPAHLHREYNKARKEFLHALSEVVKEQNVGLTASEVSHRCLELIEMLR